MLPPGFYNQVDKDIYAAGDFFIPQERFRAAPYTVGQPTNPDEVPAGIPAVYQAQGGDGGFNPYNTNMSNVRQDYNAFPSRQAGEIYSGTFNPRSLPGPQMPDKLGISTNTVPLGNNRISASQLGINLPGGQVQNAYNRARNAMNIRGDDTMSRDYPEFTAAEVARLTNDSIQDYRQKLRGSGTIR